LFDDFSAVSNLGGLVSAFPRNEFGKRSSSRNPLIFGLFERMRLVEQIGSGISKMRDLMQEEGLTTPKFDIAGMFTVTFRTPFDFEKWVEKWVEKISINRIEIIKAIHKNSIISKKELKSSIGLNGTAIDNNIDKPKELGLLERECGAKGGQWIIKFKLP
jgi:ATP-dependent DNA helicase RecG